MIEWCVYSNGNDVIQTRLIGPFCDWFYSGQSAIDDGNALHNGMTHSLIMDDYEIALTRDLARHVMREGARIGA